MPRYTYEIEPLDVLFFRDGRPFDAGSQVRSGLPTPQTVAGALRTWLLEANGCDFEALGEQMKRGVSFADAMAEGQTPQAHGVAALKIRGPWFGLDDQPVVPTPTCLRRSKGNKDGPLIRLAPLAKPPPGRRSPDGLHPLWARTAGSLESVAGYLTLAGLKTLLASGAPDGKELVKAEDLYGHDRRVSVSIAPETGTGAEGQLFSAEFLALKQKVRLLVDIIAPNEAVTKLPDSAIVPLGGEARRAIVRRCKTPISWPKPPKSKNPRRMVLLTTPGLFPDPGWRPPDLKPVAAATARAEPVSGWDMARRGPKPTRFAVPAGAVYFLDQPFVSSETDTLCVQEEAAAGWGHFVEGVWDYV
ncbi:CRISPR-associated protein Cmr3 [Azospirillaceae bacterium]